MSIPVIFYHDSNQEYLRYAVMSAEKYNDKVVLLGNASNKDFCNDWVDTDTFDLSKYHEFEKHYVHMSSNSYRFEITAFKKYFILQQYLECSEYNRCILVDSDILVCDDFSKIDGLNNVCASVSIPPYQGDYSWTASGHTFYCTEKALNEFVDFICDTYANHIDVLEEKYNWHRKNNVKGGICDMTLLYLWSRDRDDILNWLERDDNFVDHTIQSPNHSVVDQIQMDKILRVKKISVKKDGMYCYDIINKRYKKMMTVHFQGSAKPLLKDYFLNTSYFKKIIDRYCEYVKRFFRIRTNKNKT